MKIKTQQELIETLEESLRLYETKTDEFFRYKYLNTEKLLSILHKTVTQEDEFRKGGYIKTPGGSGYERAFANNPRICEWAFAKLNARVVDNIDEATYNGSFNILSGLGRGVVEQKPVPEKYLVFNTELILVDTKLDNCNFLHTGGLRRYVLSSVLERLKNAKYYLDLPALDLFQGEIGGEKHVQLGNATYALEDGEGLVNFLTLWGEYAIQSATKTFVETIKEKIPERINDIVRAKNLSEHQQQNNRMKLLTAKYTKEEVVIHGVITKVPEQELLYIYAYAIE